MLETIKQKIAQANESKQTFDSYFFKYIMQIQDDNVESEIHGLEKRHVLQVNDIARMLNEECKQLSEMVDNI